MKYSIVAQGIQEYIDVRIEEQIKEEIEMIEFYNSDSCMDSWDDSRHWIKIIEETPAFNI